MVLASFINLSAALAQECSFDTAQAVAIQKIQNPVGPQMDPDHLVKSVTQIEGSISATPVNTGGGWDDFKGPRIYNVPFSAILDPAMVTKIEWSAKSRFLQTAKARQLK